MYGAPSFASKLSPGSLSGFPEDLIILTARIVLSGEMAHVKATIAGRAEGSPLIVGPVLPRHSIGRKAFPPVIPVAIAPCAKTAVDTGATELVVCTNRKSFQSDLIGA